MTNEREVFRIPDIVIINGDKNHPKMYKSACGVSRYRAQPTYMHKMYPIRFETL